MSLGIGSGKVKEVGSCNFCTRVKYIHPNKLLYPYKKVYIISGVTIEIRICAKCLDELKKII